MGLAAVAILVTCTSTATAAVYSWQVPTGDWLVASNWGGVLPNIFDTALIANGGTAAIGLSTANCASLDLGNPGTGTLQMSRGNLFANYFEYVGSSGTGTFNQSGGINSANYTSGGLYLGYNSGASGSYNLSGSGLLSTVYEYLGLSGVGSFTQSGGTNNVTNLYIAYFSGSSGSYLLSGSGVLVSSAEFVGNSRSGAFTQSGGSNAVGNLSIAVSGRYQFSGGTLQISSFVNQGIFDATGSSGLLATGGSAIIDVSRAALVNTGSMSLTVGANSLLLIPAGFNPSTSLHSYTNLGLAHNVGTPLTILPGQGFAGAGAIADFVNCQGTISAVAGSINLNGGIALSGTGSVNLGYSGVSVNDVAANITGGTLQAGTEYVGKNGVGALTQSGGVNSTSSLYLGYNAGSSGTYTLSGLGTLSASSEYIGSSGSGTCIQTAGLNSVGYLSIGNHGRYQFSGGTLQVTRAGIASQGLFDATSSTGVLTVTGSSFADLSQAALVNTGSMSMSIGPNSLLLLPAGFDPASRLASFNNQGVAHIGGTALTISPGQTFVGDFSLGDFVSCQGALLAGNRLINLNNGLAISGTGRVYLGDGQLSVNDMQSGMTAGSLWAYSEYVGNTSNGAFAQSAGTNQISKTNLVDNTGLYLGYRAGVSGSYSLSGQAVLNLPYQYVGYSGSGAFSQVGGTNVTSPSSNAYSGGLYLGHNAGASGSYNLSGAATLAPVNEYVGYSGTGTVVQSGGTNTVYGANRTSENGRLYLAYNAGSSGSYNLGGAAILSASSEYVGYYGAGAFIQSGGSNTIGANGRLYVGAYGSGTYDLSGSGTVTAAGETVGTSAGTGAFSQSGGTNNVGSLYVAPRYAPGVGGSGAYTLSGSGVLAANTEYVYGDGTGTFVQTGGLNSTSVLNIYSLGRYQFSGGTLQITGRALSNQGSFDATLSSGVLAVTGSAIVDLSQATLVNTGSMSISVGPNALLLLPAGFNPVTSLASYSNQGLAHNAGSPLAVLPGQGFGGAGSIADFVYCQGTILATGDLINLNGGVAVAGSGNVNLGGGTFVADNAPSGVSGGLLAASLGYVGSSAIAAFAHSGGTVSVGSLYLGYNSGANGSYSLGGSAVLNATNEFVGLAGLGSLTQTGGLNSAAYLYIGRQGRYQFGGGTLQINGLSNQGVFDAMGGAGLLTVSGSQIVDFSLAVPVNAGSMSLSIGPSSLTLVPANFNPAGFGSYANQGVTHYAGTPLVISPSQAFSGGFTLNDPLTCQGTLAAVRGGSINLNAGITISGSGNVNLGAGTFTVDNASSTLSGGSLASAMGCVGYSGSGVFLQTGGLNKPNYSSYNSKLYLGYNAGSDGLYNLSDSGVLANYTEFFGYCGSGTLNQSGGSNTTGYTGSLTLGCSQASSGVYNLSGSGALTAGYDYVGLSGTGTFNQSSGTNTVNYLLQLGDAGTYNLNGGVLQAWGIQGTGKFNLGGGTLAATAAFSTSQAMTLSGSGFINTSGYAVTLSGPLSGSGGLVKLGAGTLTLSGTNQFTGGASVYGGTLILSNDDALADGSNLTIGNGATFAASPIVAETAAPSGYPRYMEPSSPVPEPGALSLAAVGLGIAAAYCRFRPHTYSSRSA